jgi:hypothetical protein
VLTLGRRVVASLNTVDQLDDAGHEERERDEHSEHDQQPFRRPASLVASCRGRRPVREEVTL